MRRWVVVLGALVAAGCSDSGALPHCPPCPTLGTTCIEGGVCARVCSPDGGTGCYTGQTCYAVCAYCAGTECACAQTFVCLPVDPDPEGLWPEEPPDWPDEPP
jgi:hypothetical protein